jgi:hypothetical protein
LFILCFHEPALKYAEQIISKKGPYLYGNNNHSFNMCLMLIACSPLYCDPAYEQGRFQSMELLVRDVLLEVSLMINNLTMQGSTSDACWHCCIH